MNKPLLLTEILFISLLLAGCDSDNIQIASMESNMLSSIESQDTNPKHFTSDQEKINYYIDCLNLNSENTFNLYNQYITESNSQNNSNGWTSLKTNSLQQKSYNSIPSPFPQNTTGWVSLKTNSFTKSNLTACISNAQIEKLNYKSPLIKATNNYLLNSEKIHQLLANKNLQLSEKDLIQKSNFHLAINNAWTDFKTAEKTLRVEINQLELEKNSILTPSI